MSIMQTETSFNFYLIQSTCTVCAELHTSIIVNTSLGILVNPGLEAVTETTVLKQETSKLLLAHQVVICLGYMQWYRSLKETLVDMFACQEYTVGIVAHHDQLSLFLGRNPGHWQIQRYAQPGVHVHSQFQHQMHWLHKSLCICRIASSVCTLVP